MSFRTYFEAGFGPETLPIIPPGVTLTHGSQVKERHRGKTPGVLTQDGTWSGLGGQWAEDRHTTIAEAKKYMIWKASVGLQSRIFLGLDIDVEDEAIAARCEELAADMLGIAPVRSRDGSPRRLLVFRRPHDGDPIRKIRVAWIDGKGAKHAVELLGHGQQYVVEGPHPKGGSYTWRYNESPCEWGPDAITVIDHDMAEAFFVELRKLIEANKWGEISRGSISSGGVPSARKKLDDPALHGSLPLVLEALKAWPNSPDTLPSHDDFVTALAAIKAALGPDREEHFDDVLSWAMEHPDAKEEYVKKTWDSIQDSSLGASWLFQAAKASGNFTAEAQEDFDDGQELAGEEGGAGDPGAEIVTSLEKMTSRFVWCQQLERYIDLQTGASLSARAFNAKNVHVAAFGRTGDRSAEAQLQNAQGALKADIVTYRPGKGTLIDDANEFGVKVNAVNLWRPSPVVPLAGVTDDMVKPWLDHVTHIFGPPGDPAREHFLNFFGFAFQRPGVKINHAPVILGAQGVGKDTVLKPIIRAMGHHNCRNIKPESLSSQFNDFLQTQLIVVQEMANFTKREVYNKLKDWIAAPPEFVEVNRKHQQPYQIPNIQLWVFFTNHDDAVALDQDDRRFWVHRALAEAPQPADYYDRLHRWIDDEQGAAKVAGWLTQRDISVFNPSARPPMTAAKQVMLDHALPGPVKLLRQKFAEGGVFEERTVLTASELKDEWEGINDRHATAALKASGFVLGPKVRLADGVRQLWVRSDTPASRQGSELVRARWLKESRRA